MLTQDRWAPTDLSHNRVNLFHAQRKDAGQEGLESLTRLLHHHLQDFQELLHHSTPCTALLQNTGCQLFPGQHTGDNALNCVIPTFSVFVRCKIFVLFVQNVKLFIYFNLVNMLRKVWMICPVKATPIWTLNAWNSVKKKANISSVTSGKEKWQLTKLVSQTNCCV